MKILVTFALETEFAPWRSMHGFRRAQWGQGDVYFAEIGGAEVGVILTGVGPRLAGLRASDVIRSERESIGVCISSGLAGALRTEYAVGDVLAAKAVRSETVRSDINSRILECSPALRSFAQECGATIVDSFYTSERAIGTPEEKAYLGQLADAVDMESFEVVREAAACGIPAIAIRAVSDIAKEKLPLDMNEVFTDQGQVSVPRVLGQVARHPQALPALMKLGSQSKTAAEKISRFLDRFVATVADRTAPLQGRSAAI